MQALNKFELQDLNQTKCHGLSLPQWEGEETLQSSLENSIKFKYSQAVNKYIKVSYTLTREFHLKSILQTAIHFCLIYIAVLIFLNHHSSLKKLDTWQFSSANWNVQGNFYTKEWSAKMATVSATMFSLGGFQKCR